MTYINPPKQTSEISLLQRQLNHAIDLIACYIQQNAATDYQIALSFSRKTGGNVEVNGAIMSPEGDLLLPQDDACFLTKACLQTRTHQRDAAIIKATGSRDLADCAREMDIPIEIINPRKQTPKPEPQP